MFIRIKHCIFTGNITHNMYLVDFKVFRQFLINKKMDVDTLPACDNIPAIVVYKRGETLLAKVEVYNYADFKFQIQHPGTGHKSQNKYWIRGKEWQVVNGKQIQELIY